MFILFVVILFVVVFFLFPLVYIVNKIAKRSRELYEGVPEMAPTKKAPKRAKKSIPDKLAYNMSTNNTFTALAAAENRQSRKTAHINNIPKLPVPITVTDTKTNIDEVIKPLNIKYSVKIISIGKKIFVESHDERQTVIAALAANKISCFSHPSNEEKVFKVVLAGLPAIKTETLAESLRLDNNLTPKKIIQISKNANNVLYLMHFNKKEVNMANLRIVSVVFNHIIKWLPYKPNRQGPTQCYNCGMFGHGASCCHRPAVCLLCSGDHTMKDCHIKKDDIPVLILMLVPLLLHQHALSSHTLHQVNSCGRLPRLVTFCLTASMRYPNAKPKPIN